MKFALLLLVTLGLSAQTKQADLCAPPPGAVAPSLPARLLSGQGRIDFPITTSNPKAQEFFNQGVAQMHSFWAIEAERSFLQAAALDPEAPMPQWGIAMVAAGDYRPRFQLVRENSAGFKGASAGEPKKLQGGPLRAVEAAQKALKLSQVPGKATEVEKLYIASIAARREQNPADPDAAYIDGLRKIAAAYPGEVEAKTYLALHLMQGFNTPEKQPREGSMEAVALLRDLLKQAPDHAGVHHYVIHGWEGSTFAKEAWESCRRYPELVSNIPHALHMPGHIWAQTGKWSEAVASFDSAAVNERGYLRADKFYGNGHHGHNMHFLASSAAFSGSWDKAFATARELLSLKENPREAAAVDNFRTAYRQGWFAMLATLVQFEKWDLILDGSTLPDYHKPRETAWRHWAVGLAQAAKGNRTAAAAERKAMNPSLKELKRKTGDTPPALLVARRELDGQIAFAARKTSKALRLLDQASADERRLRYNEPPSYPRPVAEVLGRLALSAGRTQIAESAFRTALSQYPESPRAQSGLAEVLKREGKPIPAGL